MKWWRAIYITRSFAHFCVHRVSSLIKISLIDSNIVGLFSSGTSLRTSPFLKTALHFFSSRLAPDFFQFIAFKGRRRVVVKVWTIVYWLKLMPVFPWCFRNYKRLEWTSFFPDLLLLAGNSHFCMSLDRGDGNDSLGKKIMRSIIRLFFSIAYFKGYVFLIWICPISLFSFIGT